MDSDVVVQDLLENSPAAKSKLNVGDIIRKIDGEEIKKPGDLANTAFLLVQIILLNS